MRRLKSSPATIDGFLRRYRRRNAEHDRLRSFIRQLMQANLVAATDLITRHGSGLLSEEEFIVVLRQRNARDPDILMAEYPSMDDGRFKEVVEELYSGLFTKEQFIHLAYGIDKASGFDVYLKKEQSITRFLSHERETFLALFEYFMPASRVQELKDQGKTEDDIYDGFVQVCLQYDVYSLQCLPFGKTSDQYYRLTYFDDTVERIRRTVKSTTTQMIHVTEAVLAVQSSGIDLQLPAPNGSYKHLIEEGHDPAKVLQLPSEHSCPSCHRPFASATALAVHRRRYA